MWPSWQALSAIAVTVLLHICFRRLWHHTPQSKQPDLYTVPGLPLLGSTLTFAVYGVDLLAWASRQARHAFAIRLMGRQYIFLTSPEAVQLFSTLPSTTLALQPAVAPFTQKCFGLSSQMWQGGEAKPAHALRALLLPAKVEAMAPRIAQVLKELAPAYFEAQQPTDLATAVPRWTMHDTVAVLFGAAFLQSVDVPELLDKFTRFDEYFEAGASPLPAGLFPQFTRSRAWLLAHFSKALEQNLFAGTVAGSVLKNAQMPGSEAPAVLLALLWASLSNVSASAFWAVAFLLLPEHAHWQQALRAELAAAESAEVAKQDGGMLQACIDEAIRLRAESIVLRYAQRDFQLPGAAGTRVPAGSLVATSPYELHHDERCYCNAATYYPPRHLTSGAHTTQHCPQMAQKDLSARGLISQAAQSHSVASHSAAGGNGTAQRKSKADPAPVHIAFGAGTFRCPGRAFAKMQLRMAVATMFTLCDMNLTNQAADTMSPSCGAQQAHAVKARLRSRPPGWLSEGCVPGEHVLARGMHSGDPSRHLPQARAQLLVGIKRPLGQLLASCERINSASVCSEPCRHNDREMTR